MNSGTPSILIVDDEPADLGAVKRATELCLQLLAFRNPSITVAYNKDDALAKYNDIHPELLITDLFLPMKPFAKLEWDEQCKEMEWPHGLMLLNERARFPQARTLVTTFFWNYPGFARHMDTLYKRLKIDAAMPKDIFFAVATLKDYTTLDDLYEYPPGRILLNTFNALLRTKHGQKLDEDLRKLNVRCLFDEASAWMRIYPHQVLDIRSEIFVDPPIDGPPKKVSKPTSRYKAWDEYAPLTQQMVAGPWLPSFVVVSQPASEVHGENSYAEVLKIIAETTDWHIDLEMPNPIAMKMGHGYKRIGQLRWGDREIEVKCLPREPRHMVIEEPLLSPKRRTDTKAEIAWAQLLITLGFFSYWCHLPDHRAVRTREEIAELIKRSTGEAYRSTAPKDVDKKLVADLNDLDVHIVRHIKKKKNDWWRYLPPDARNGFILSRKQKRSNKQGYWLNGSIRFRGLG